MKRSLISLLSGTLALLVAACAPINVMGRNVPDSEYQALYDREIAREKSGLKPDGRTMNVAGCRRGMSFGTGREGRARTRRRRKAAG
jgi:hypothetical protein